MGRIGTVIRRVRGGALPGEVRLMLDGMAHYYLAYAPTPIAAGSPVLVVHCRGARMIDVEPWQAPATDS